MLFWIFACFAVHLVSIYLAAILYLPQLGLANALGGHEDVKDPSILTGRAQKAAKNLQENLPIFLGLALLSYVIPEVALNQAVLGAMIFVVARVAYIPAYLSAIPGLRTVVYGISMFGLGMMAVALI